MSIKSALTAEEWSARVVELPEGLSLTWDAFGVNLKSRREDGVYLRHTTAILTVMAVLNAVVAASAQREGVMREDVRIIRRFWEIACCCGVITSEDFEDWDTAQKQLPNLADRIESLLPPESAV